MLYDIYVKWSLLFSVGKPTWMGSAYSSQILSIDISIVWCIVSWPETFECGKRVSPSWQWKTEHIWKKKMSLQYTVFQSVSDFLQLMLMTLLCSAFLGILFQ